jgi:hypothetical protein
LFAFVVVQGFFMRVYTIVLEWARIRNIIEHVFRFWITLPNPVNGIFGSMFAYTTVILVDWVLLYV